MIAVAASGLCWTGAVAVAATPKTSNMSVSMTVISECTLTADALSFGQVVTTDLAAAAAEATGALNIQCTNGTAYSITMDAGAGTGATAAVRKMTSGTDTLDYSVYSDSAHTTLIGGTGDELTGTADGTAQAIPIYGLAPIQTVPVGSYSDTVTVTLTY